LLTILLAIFIEGSKSRNCDYIENAKLSPATSRPAPQKLNLEQAAGRVHFWYLTTCRSLSDL